MKKNLYKFSIILFFILFLNCFPYVTHDREEVLIEGVDIDQTLDIAVIELEEADFDSVLTIWVMRDQVINEVQASRIAYMYFEYINVLENDFAVWHLAWAISNLYRLGNDKVKMVLDNAYRDAKTRPETLKKFKQIADTHINDELIYMGDVHDLGRAYSYSHVVVPGNKEYIQSYDEYMEKKKK